MEKKYEHLKLLTMPRSILFYKNDKNIVKKIKITKLREVKKCEIKRRTTCTSNFIAFYFIPEFTTAYIYIIQRIQISNLLEKVFF